MKKFIFIILACVLAFFCAGCGTFRPPIILNPDDQTTQSPEEGGSGTEDEGPVYTVALKQENGRTYIPPEPITAQWRSIEEGNSSVFTAEFNAAGIARATGLDGDYRITLSNLPDGYAYDPNNGGDGYIASSDNRNLSITIFRLKPLSGDGHTLYMNNLSMSEPGMYRVTLTSRTEKLYFELTPNTTGLYTIESCADISANEINPKLQFYEGTDQFKNPTDLVDGGGSSSTFTQNFKIQRTIGNGEVGAAICFAVWAESNRGYPVTVDIKITQTDIPATQTIMPNGPYYDGAKPAGAFTYLYSDFGTNLADIGKKIKLDWDDKNGDGKWQEGEGDGFYETLYSSTNGYGPMLYVKVSRPIQLFQEIIEPDRDGIQRAELVNMTNVFNDYNYSAFFTAYMDYLNTPDGAHPVNAEIMLFLQRYALYFRLFLDGVGPAETSSYALRSDEESQWLFACGYYK